MFRRYCYDGKSQPTRWELPPFDMILFYLGLSQVYAFLFGYLLCLFVRPVMAQLAFPGHEPLMSGCLPCVVLFMGTTLALYLGIILPRGFIRATAFGVAFLASGLIVALVSISAVTRWGSGI